MTREELRDTMRVSGELERLKKSENWDKAFEMYKAQTKDYEVSTGCHTCFTKVKRWLTQ